MYTERSLSVINAKNKKRFQKLMNERIDGLEKDSQKKRVLKVLKAVEKLV